MSKSETTTDPTEPIAPTPTPAGSRPPWGSDDEFNPEKAWNLLQNVRGDLAETRASLEAARKVGDEGVEALRLKALETIKTSTDASFDFARALAGCKTLADAFALQNEHARKQVEAFNVQAKDYSSLVQKVAHDTMSPLTASFGKGFGLTA